MKLRNKKTGGIGYLIVGRGCDYYRVCKDDWSSYGKYLSLAELNEEWEDYEEPKEYWFIDWCSDVEKEPDEGTEADKACKAIGNKFKTKEEAEEAVEKLKAWKRLKDKGFRFDGYDVAHNSNGDLCGQLFYNAGDYCIEDVEKDLDLLFGGEE